MASAASSSAALPANATTLTINGVGFDSNAANDTVTFSNGVTGTVSAASATSLDITGLSNLPAVGTPLYSSVSVDGTTTATAQVATISSSTVIYTVTSATGTSAGTLPYAIANAQNGEEITFASSLSGSTITLGSVLTIAGNLTIVGLGAANLAISGNNATQVFNVQSGAVANISGLTIQNGIAASGGGVYNAGGLTLSYVTLLGNSAHSYGGGIDNVGILTLSNATLSGNSAVYGGGGGIRNNSGMLTLTAPRSGATRPARAAAAS